MAAPGSGILTSAEIHDSALLMNAPFRNHSAPTSGTFTSDFRHQFEAETTHLLRERFLWFNALLGGIWTLMLVWGLFSAISDLFTKGMDWGSWDLNRLRSDIGHPVFEGVAV